MQKLSFKNVGPPNVPHEIKVSRRQVLDAMLYLGQPIVHMHIWNVDDVEAGVAKACPACFDSAYGQVRNDCQICFGVGWVSVEDNDQGYFINDRGRLAFSGTIRAPKYGGFGSRTLTWLMEPDKATDFFKLTDEGALVKIQNSEAYAPWYPDMNDNDLLINVKLNRDLTVASENKRYQLKMSNPMSIRGWGKRQQGLREAEYQVGQQFEMILIPENTILYQVPLDVE